MYAQNGCITGASKKNWDAYKKNIVFTPTNNEKTKRITKWQQLLLCDPQTSGGILASVDDKVIKKVHKIAKKMGFISADIGNFEYGLDTRSSIEVLY